VIDEIGEPLIHLIRNAMDHGIESPEEREAMGKPRQGTICVSARQESSHLIITVEDDGRGIDEDKVLAKALAAGILGADEITRGSAADLIFHPGFSTADEVTEVSGRGVGMDAVRKSLAKINGVIEVNSTAGMGAIFTIKLPLTLAIVSALMVRSGDEKFAVPLTSVVESIKVDAGQLHKINQRSVMKVRDQVLPVVRLGLALGAEGWLDGNESFAVVARGITGKMAILVDELLGQQEIVIKPLDEYLGNVRGIAGATILGDGKVALIVDALELLECARNNGSGALETRVA
jgi:two-component system, chemotaxis family, sensor kinase CheA